MNIVIVGQKKFGMRVLQLCEELGHTIQLVCTPYEDHMYKYAEEKGYKVLYPALLNEYRMPKDCDLGISAHSFMFIGEKVRNQTKHGFLGYHPSLLPRHRGKSAIEWALRMKDLVTGGTLYWLDSHMDRGDICLQDWFWLDHNRTAKQAWDIHLLPMGLELFRLALSLISQGIVNRVPQALFEQFASEEPSLEPGKLHQ